MAFVVRVAHKFIGGILRKDGDGVQEERVYIAIDLKSFYASVECKERGLDPMTTHLVVADPERTEKTICLAVSPSLKSYGIPGRPRLFEVVQKVKEVNQERKRRAPGNALIGKSWDDGQVKQDPSVALDYLVAPPRMALYVDYSTQIYHVYLKYVAPEDIHVYSIDEVFMDVTSYLKGRDMTPRQFASMMVQDVMATTGITATAGIGTNLYLCKIAMDIVAKHAEADENGVRMGQLDEKSYRRLLWNHRPLTDFWRVGRGYAKRLEEQGLYTMGDIARCSLGKPNQYYNEELLYKMFGVNAELLIDHAWGYEPCTMKEIKSYRPEVTSTGTGQVLHCPYSFEKARLVVREMTDLLVLDLVDKGMTTNQIVLTVGYDIDNLKAGKTEAVYQGTVTIDRYGRNVPKHAHGTVNLEEQTSSTSVILEAVTALYDRIVNPALLVRRIHVVANHLEEESVAAGKQEYRQLQLFTDYASAEKEEVEKRNVSKKKRICRRRF